MVANLQWQHFHFFAWFLRANVLFPATLAFNVEPFKYESISIGLQFPACNINNDL